MASTSLGSLLEMQDLRLHSTLAKSESAFLQDPKVTCWSGVPLPSPSFIPKIDHEPSFIPKIHHYQQHKTQDSLATLLFNSFTFTTPHQPQPSMWQNLYSEQITQTTTPSHFLTSLGLAQPHCHISCLYRMKRSF